MNLQHLKGQDQRQFGLLVKIYTGFFKKTLLNEHYLKTSKQSRSALEQHDRYRTSINKVDTNI